MTAPKPGHALTAALKAADTRKGSYDNAKRNQAAEKELVYQGDLSLPELLEVQPNLRAAFYARNPHFLGS